MDWNRLLCGHEPSVAVWPETEQKAWGLLCEAVKQGFDPAPSEHSDGLSRLGTGARYARFVKRDNIFTIYFTIYFPRQP